VRGVLAATDRNVALGNIALVDESNDRFLVSQNLFVQGSATFAGPTPGLVTPYYSIGSQGGTYSTTSSSLVAVDATNLSILTPVVPNTSSVRIRATATVEALGAPNVQFQLAISDSVNGIIGVVQGMTAATGGSLPVTVEAVLAGGGQFAHTFELWWAVITAAATLSMLNGSNGTPFPLMIVEVNQ